MVRRRSPFNGKCSQYPDRNVEDTLQCDCREQVGGHPFQVQKRLHQLSDSMWWKQGCRHDCKRNERGTSSDKPELCVWQHCSLNLQMPSCFVNAAWNDERVPIP